MNLPFHRPKVLVFEPTADGHHSNYVRTVIDAVYPLAEQVVFCTQESTIESPGYAINFAQHPENMTLDLFQSHEKLSVLRSQIYFARMYLNAIKRLRPDYVYVPTADGLIQFIGWLRILTGNRNKTPPAEMLCMRGHRYLGMNGSWGNALKRQWALAGIRASGCTKLHALDEGLRRLFADANLGRIQLSLMPETRSVQQIPDKTLARKEFGLECKDIVVGFFGHRSKRKGFDLLLNAFASLSNPDAKLLILGQDDEATTDRYESLVQTKLGHRVVSRNAYVSSEELLLGMTAADVICIPYPSHEGSSGFLVDAAATGNMLLTTDYGWIGETMKRYELGITCDVQSPSAFASALNQAMRDCKSFQPSSSATNFLNWNNPENVKAKWSVALAAYHPTNSRT